MADDTTTTDPQDERIAQLEKQVAELESELDAAAKNLKAADANAARLQAKLDAAKSAPTGDVAYFRGEAYAIIGDFRADNTFVEVKRGYCPEGITLLAIERQH